MESVVQKLNAARGGVTDPSEGVPAENPLRRKMKGVENEDDVDDEDESKRDTIGLMGKDLMMKERSQLHYRGMGNLLKMKAEDFDDEEDDDERDGDDRNG